MSRGAGMALSTARYTCHRRGRAIRPGWRARMCRRTLALPPSRLWRWRLIDRARDAGVPFAWVTADTVYGTGAVEIALRRAGKGYVLGVSATSQFNSWGAKPPVAGTAAGIAAALDPSAWHRLSAGAGSKGERLFDWAYLE